MKKVTINLLVVLFFATMLVACGGNSNNDNHNDEVELDEETNTEIVENKEEEVVENKIDFTKFEHYATILTKEDLTMKFGESDLLDGVDYYAEGTVEKHSTTLTNSTNGYVIKFIWGDDGNTTDWIEANYNLYGEDYDIIGTQMVITESGLFTGMSLSGLRDWNGADFKFSGFGWDYGGGIYAEEGSKIFDSPVRMSLDMLNYEGFDFAFGDIDLMADDDRLEYAGIIVSQLTIYID